MTPTTDPANVLLVDDRDENLVALEALLRRDGLTLLRAGSGPDALELLLRHDMALALVDVQMPGMDGFELAELMRGTERTRRVPLIFVTAGHADRQRRFRGYEAGAVDFIQKPIEPDVLRGKVAVFVELFRQRQEVARLLAESRAAAEALRDADRRKDEFLALLAHELRNPLAPIRNGVQLLRAGAGREAADRTLGMMDRQLGHLVHLVDDLTDVARVSSGKMVLRRGPVDLRAVVEAAVETSRDAVDRGGHHLAVALPPDPLVLDADRTRLAQVLSNLLNNAAKYTPPGGRITLAAARDGGHAVVRVADTGVGIPADMLPRVFDLFTQVGSSLDRSQGGLGIGLTLVRRLVEMHGGSVTAASPGPDRGSEFVVRLPLAAAPAAAADPPPAPAAPAGRRVLIADDHRDGAESLAEMLRLLGNEVYTAGDGAEAVAQAERVRPEVILMDVGMPRLNGLDATRQIRGQAWGRAVTILALSGWGQEADRERSRAAGCDGHLVKPVTLAELRRALGDVPAPRA